MIKIKMKKCSGSGKAKGFGCGEMSSNRKYGLSLTGCKCYQNWLFSTDAGKEMLSKATLQASRKVSNEKKKEKNDKRRSDKILVKTRSQHLKELQTLINSIVRLIDHDKGCISCNHGWESSWTRQKHAGHRLSVGSTPELRFNFFNIYLQCSICNNWKSGNERSYDKGLIKHYGQSNLSIINDLRAKYPSLQISIPEIQESIVKAKDIKKSILDGKNFTREEINILLSIYK